MRTPFFITGLPRSRSAWLANWLTTDASLVYHDVPLPMDLRGEWRQVGFSGPELAVEYEMINRLYPGARWVVVLRNEADAKAAFIRWAGAYLGGAEAAFEAVWKERVAAIARLTTQLNVRTVPFEQLDDPVTARGLWEYLLPDQAFDADRWRVLNEMNVQQMLQKWIKRCQAEH